MNKLKVGLLASGALGSSIAIACCMAFGDEPVSLTGENAIIIWDSDNKKQHFIRQASFDGAAKDFGFIVPTPAVPEVKVADEKAFEILQSLAYRNIEADSAAAGTVTSASASKGVEVIDEFQVGDYSAAIIKASDATDLDNWLTKNGYHSRPAMKPWLDHYAKKGWVFTALKFTRTPGKSKPETSALRISFSAEKPFYPYKMPDDTWPKGHIRPLNLYFLSKRKIEAEYEGTNTLWEAETVYSGKLPEAERKEILPLLSLASEDIPNGYQFTMFTNYRNEHGFDKDLAFNEKSSGGATVAIAVGASVSILAALAITRRSRMAKDAKEIPSPDEADNKFQPR